VVAAGWLAVHWLHERAREAEQRETLRREVQAATPALQALRGLQSVTQARLTFRDYTPRVLDAKVLVDSYTAALGGLGEVKTAMREAMALYRYWPAPCGLQQSPECAKQDRVACRFQSSRRPAFPLTAIARAPHTRPSAASRIPW
jgi:hypothetical protein